MRKSWIALGALAACVIALGLFVWLKPPRLQDPAHAVSTLKPADARTLRVLRKGRTLAALEKRNGQWFMTEPIPAPADDFQVLRLLAVLEAKSALQYPASEAAKFELDQPATELIIDDQLFAFGAINTVTREQYMLTQNQIFPLEMRFAAAVPVQPLALLRRSVLAPNDTPLRFEFGGFVVATDEKKWSTAPPAGDLSQDDYNRWVAQWRDGSALRTEVSDARKAATEIHITLKDGARITLGIVQTEPELIVRRTDLGLQFVFVGDVGKQMMSPPTGR